MAGGGGGSKHTVPSSPPAAYLMPAKGEEETGEHGVAPHILTPPPDEYHNADDASAAGEEGQRRAPRRPHRPRVHQHPREGVCLWRRLGRRRSDERRVGLRPGLLQLVHGELLWQLALGKKRWEPLAQGSLLGRHRWEPLGQALVHQCSFMITATTTQHPQHDEVGAA